MIGIDLRYALRTAMRQRSYTAVIVLTFALTFAAAVAVFSAIQSMLLDRLDLPNSERIVAVTTGQGSGRGFDFSWRNFEDVRAQTKSFAATAAYYSTSWFLFETRPAESRFGSAVSQDYFGVLGVKPLLGRPFTAADHVAGAAPVVAISESMWKARYGGDPKIIGRVIRLGKTPEPRTVIAVMPPGGYLSSTETTDFWVPLLPTLGPFEIEMRESSFLTVVGLLRPAATIEQARAELVAVGARLAPLQLPGVKFAIDARSLHEQVTAPVRPALFLLASAAALVLLIGGANVANLLLARATTRQREMAIRTAVGASPLRIIRQLLTESVFLATIAGVAALVLAVWCTGAIISTAPAGIPRLEAVSFDARVVFFAIALAIVAGVVFGAAPALAALRTDLTAQLKDGAHSSTTGRSRHALRSLLVGGEIALAIILLAGTGLLLRSFLRLNAVSAGFAATDRATIRLTPRETYDTPEKLLQFFQSVVTSLEAVPGVHAAAGASTMPLSGANTKLPFKFVGAAPQTPGAETSAHTVLVTPGFFRTLAVPLIQGRDVAWSDGFDSENVMLVNEAFARRHFGNSSPIGKRLTVMTRDARTIIGVTGDVRAVDLAEPAAPAMYIPVTQLFMSRLTFVVHGTNASELAPVLRRAIERVDPEQPVEAVTTLEKIRRDSIGAERFTLVLLAALGTIALLLAATGIFSTTSYTVEQRIPEIGIRVALGAQRGDVLRLIVGGMLRIALIGTVAGAMIALALSQFARSVLYGITPADPLTFTAICAIVAATALVASWLPARRAARVDPLVAIRYD